MNTIDELEVLLAEARVEAQKFFESGNKSAGTRLRAKMQNITQLCKKVRNDVSAIKNAE
jgi:hypothetical protein